MTRCLDAREHLMRLREEGLICEIDRTRLEAANLRLTPMDAWSAIAK